MKFLDVCWFDWIVFAVCWSLNFLCYAVRRWRLRVYLIREVQLARLLKERQRRAASQGWWL